MIARRARYNKIERITDQLLDKAGITSPSVNIKTMVRHEGIEIRSITLGKVSGLLARDGKQTIIGINRDQAVVRQRFTMAHEYGHYILHEGLQSHFDERFRINYRNEASATAGSVVEIEANYFAACLLMPRRFLDIAQALEFMDDDAGVKRLARIFSVSQHAMSLRLANLYRAYSPF